MGLAVFLILVDGILIVDLWWFHLLLALHNYLPLAWTCWKYCEKSIVNFLLFSGVPTLAIFWVKNYWIFDLFLHQLATLIYRSIFISNKWVLHKWIKSPSQDRILMVYWISGILVICANLATQLCNLFSQKSLKVQNGQRHLYSYF